MNSRRLYKLFNHFESGRHASLGGGKVSDARMPGASKTSVLANQAQLLAESSNRSDPGCHAFWTGGKVSYV